MKKTGFILAMCLLLLGYTQCRKANPAALSDDAAFDPRLSGGAATTFDISSLSFSAAIPGLSARDAHVHTLGDKIFEQSFVAAPAPLYGGLGPVFNNVSCVSCHHNDGSGLPTAGLVNSSLLIRLSLPGTDPHGGPAPVPGFGNQLQDVSLFGVPAEAVVNITYTEQPFTFPDGETVSLRKPTYTLSSPYMPMPAGYLMSPRLAPPVFGLGLLELVPEATIRSFVDAADQNKDGVTGKANYVYNPYTKRTELGRFGLKANTSTLQLQVSAAMQQDMGITSYVFPQKSVYGQSQMSFVKDTAGPDLPDSLVDAVRFYVQSLAVPARRDVTDPTVQHGEQLFAQIGCASCHRPTMYTDVNVNLPALSHQRIHPYTDLLVHDMGPGLADNRPDYLANGNEWRTSPLWGIGLFEKTNGTPYYLHDGRARSLKEAILWHGGESQNSLNQFTKLSRADREAIIMFLQSL